MVKGNVKHSGLVMQDICSKLEPILDKVGFADDAPFKTVSIIIRFGEVTNLVPDYGQIDKRHMELPVAVELEMSKLRFAERKFVEDTFFHATVSVLLDVAKKYDLPSSSLMSLNHS